MDRRSKHTNQSDADAMIKVAKEILKEQAEHIELALSAELFEQWQSAHSDEKFAFFLALAETFDVDSSEIDSANQAYQQAPSAKHFARLQRAAEPSRRELIRRLNRVPGGTVNLVSMRCDLLEHLKTHEALSRVDYDFQHLFTSWFNRGFLTLEQISWRTPAHVLEKIIRYESVHEIQNWADLRRRVDPDDRLCFAFFHPAMPDEPLIFVEVALLDKQPNSIDAILRGDACDLDKINTAAFYSISNCQVGLRGISFGNSLIKQVVSVLSSQFPSINQFMTLSPIPGFRQWTDSNETNPEPQNLLALAAQYLANEKNSRGQPLDAVARFHLSNGAEIYDVHEMADSSAKGHQQSYGVMVNYRYVKADIAKNHERYIGEHHVASSKRIQTLAKKAGR